MAVSTHQLILLRYASRTLTPDHNPDVPGSPGLGFSSAQWPSVFRISNAVWSQMSFWSDPVVFLCYT